MNPFKLMVNLIALLTSLGFLDLILTMVRRLLVEESETNGTTAPGYRNQ